MKKPVNVTPHSPRYSSYCSIALMLAAASGVNVALAQDMSTQAMSTRASTASEAAKTRAEEYHPLGLHVGSFYFYPLLEAGLIADSNIFRLPDEFKEPDQIIYGMGKTAMRSDWNRHELNALVWIKGGSYQDFDSEDYLDYKITTDGRYDVLRNSFFTGKAGYMHLHQDRSSLNNRGGVEPTQYDLGYLGVGYDHQPNRIGIRFNLDYVTLDFENVESVIGTTINNDQRDRDRTEATLRLGYELWDARSVFFQIAVNSVDYDQKVDDAGFEKSSNGSKVIAGVNFNLTSLIVGDAFIGYVQQSYDDPLFEELSDPLIGFSLEWFATGLTTVRFSLDRNPQETVEPRSSGYMSTQFHVEVNHELRRNLILVGGLRHISNRYEQTTLDSKEKDVTFGADLGVKYYFNRRFYARADYRYRQRTSDDELQDYNLNRFEIAAGVRW